MVAKAACKAVTAKMAVRFLPVQVGFGVPQATEAAAHAAHAYVSEPQLGEGLLKLDFINAFNMVYHDAMSQTVLEEMPEMYPFIHMSNEGFLTGAAHKYVFLALFYSQLPGIICFFHTFNIGYLGFYTNIYSLYPLT